MNSPSGTRAFTVTTYGQEVRHTIEPSHYGVRRLAAELGDAWLTVTAESPALAWPLGTAIREFCRSVSRQLASVDGIATFGLSRLRRRHLDAWEQELLARHKRAHSDTNYRHGVYMLALLRRIEDDHPDTLHAEVLLRLEQPTRLNHVRNEGTAAFTSSEVKRIRSSAHKVVHHYFRSPGEPAPRRTELVALHVLLSLATGEPPEVLRQLTVDHLTATCDAESDDITSYMSHPDRLTWLAQHDRIEQLAVTYLKNRAGGLRRQEVYTRTDKSALKAFSDIIKVTANLRDRAPDFRELWLYQRWDGAVREVPWSRGDWALRRWFTQQGIEVEGPIWYQRLHKVVLAREAKRQGALYVRRQTRQTTDVFFNHYAQSSVVRAHAGGLLVEVISRYFEAAQHAPTVITPDAEDLLRQGRRVDEIPDEVISDLLDGNLDGPHAACTDPENSPFESNGVVCTRSMTGLCFGCENAIITQDHLPAALLIASIADPEKSADPAQWNTHWRQIHQMLTEVILPAFPASAIAHAESLLGDVPLDAGVANDMRGTGE